MAVKITVNKRIQNYSIALLRTWCAQINFLRMCWKEFWAGGDCLELSL